jgi:hypothetical protein
MFYARENIKKKYLCKKTNIIAPRARNGPKGIFVL